MSLYQYFQPLRHFSVRQYILLHVLSYDCRLNAAGSRRTNLKNVFQFNTSMPYVIFLIM